MRKKIVQRILSENIDIEQSQFEGNVSEWFGINTFNDEAMKGKLSKSVYNKLKKCRKAESDFTIQLANEIAHGMKEWALERGCTHYAHWFQPLTGSTAEKHDAFITTDGKSVIERFSGKELFKQEPDASSFPCGGLRATFEARGYTAWDPTSPAFIIEDDSGNTLCIPSVFVSYNGHSLDQKSPLLRSAEALEISTLRLLKLFGDKDKRVFSGIGSEQEYFLIDRKLAYLRPDLVITGRTLFGAKPPKGQELDDQYFGSIKERMLDYMRDVETESYKLGIPLKTRHNEVAPHQYEFAPVFEEANIAADHNQLLMEIMKKNAQKHGFFLSMHEKPFSRINGSGKHVNWSINTEKQNLFQPTKNANDKVKFLTFLLAAVRGVYKHPELLRASIASASNDNRLGANEAPPPIISIFLGRALADIKSIEIDKADKRAIEKILDLGASKLPNILKDNTDRNRTSPFAFTGNKFEFRAPGAMQAIAIPVTILNTITAESIDYIYEKLNKKRKNKDFFEASVEVLKEIILEIKPILFEGDNYTDEWVKEAKKRGLPILKTTPEAVIYYEKDKTVKLFEKYGVLSKEELEARCEIELERYCKTISIECHTALEIARTKIYPAAVKYQNLLIKNISGMKEYFDNYSMGFMVENKLKNICELTDVLLRNIDELEKILFEVENEEDNLKEISFRYAYDVIPLLQNLRAGVDELELVIDDELWNMPKYYELLFID
ncbi:MAG: glutamine synthetase III [Candidatus Muiribacteriota bacterium]